MVVAAFLAGWLLITKRHGWGGLFLIVMLVCQGLLIVDAQQHFGTTIKTVTSTAKIAPITSAKGNHVLVTEQLKKGKTVYTAYATRKPTNQKSSASFESQKTSPGDLSREASRPSNQQSCLSLHEYGRAMVVQRGDQWRSIATSDGYVSVE